MITPDHLALVIFCAATKATLRSRGPVKKSQFTCTICQARTWSSGDRRKSRRMAPRIASPAPTPRNRS
jgi:hypothetical protein